MKEAMIKFCPICGKKVRKTDHRGTFYCSECWHEIVYIGNKISIYAITSKGNRVTIKVIPEPMAQTYLEYRNY